MLEFITSLPGKLVEHFAAMTTLVFVATIIKFILPLLSYLLNRFFEHRSYKRWMEIPGMTEERARREARALWRPKSKPPKWLLKVKAKLSPPRE
ncbi:hypothetical protein UXN72_08575 [Enterobacter hormaechei]|uniref:hypothetical protein n=1 Tax=Enterobacter cloacae complex TaxID=354276 RepID=UPI00093D4B6F|nr:hypothetical protein [Enterobacter hormaechei]HBM2626348.1 hypothetical protein [Enterobacter hormaechei subsp. hoffmannii]MCE1374051.1 hypothetical protein [Enterobacter hormaechei]MCM7790604.1 hypothetical protein [Enterobacter hormaechei]WGZ51350.1 hypothetical protein MOG78_07475 [Enterobacter hormaechei]HBM2650527.1 hypothetical protein [Enterobacter hormaechei subsp. hoffmannii]